MIANFRLKRIIDFLIGYVRADYASHLPNDHHSFLYKVLEDEVIGNKVLFEDAKAIFITNTDHPKHIEVRPMFDHTRAPIPTIHIGLAGENPFGDGISFDNNYESPEFDDENNTYNLNNTRGFNTQYNLNITSCNSDEVSIIYHVLMALLIGAPHILELNGIRNPKMSGGDLMTRDITPVAYMRILKLNFFYELSVPQIVLPQDTSIISKFIWDGKAISSEEETQSKLNDSSINYGHANESLVNDSQTEESSFPHAELSGEDVFLYANNFLKS